MTIHIRPAKCHTILTSAAVTVAVCIGGTALAQDSAGDTKINELETLVKDLRKQVDELKAAESDRWLTQQRSDEIRALVHDVLADADTRASLLQSGAVAGYDKGFFLGSADGNYLLRLSGQIQFRAVYNMQSESPVDDDRFGFEMRRTKVFFTGHVFDPTWTYQIEIEASRSGGSFGLGENGWIRKDLENGLGLRFGQFKPAFAREEGISSRKLQSVERSQINSQFSAGTAQGVQVEYDADRWRARGAFIDGAGTGNTAWSTEDTEYAFTGRFEYIFQGEWKDIDDDIAFRGGNNALAVGAAALYQNAEYGSTFNDAEGENLTLTADAIWKAGSFSLTGAAFYRMLSIDATDAEFDQYGIMIRGGYFLNEHTELYVMYEWGDLDIDGIENLSVITVGFTRYFDKHNLKWQNDVGYGFNSVASSWAVDSAGWRADAPDEDGQFVVRSQFQLLF